jgi:defect-in-organelle-trafficking protein DotD
VLPQGVSMSDVPVELTKLVTIDWVGGVEGISERLALEAGYQFVRIGTPPAAPIVVDVVAHARPVFELLQHVGLQMRGRGELVINPSARKVEVRYATR